MGCHDEWVCPIGLLGPENRDSRYFLSFQQDKRLVTPPVSIAHPDVLCPTARTKDAKTFCRQSARRKDFPSGVQAKIQKISALSGGGCFSYEKEAACDRWSGQSRFSAGKPRLDAPAPFSSDERPSSSTGVPCRARRLEKLLVRLAW